MSIALTCPKCLHKSEVPAAQAGSVVVCPSCGDRLRVPGEPPPKPERLKTKPSTPPPKRHRHWHPPTAEVLIAALATAIALGSCDTLDTPGGGTIALLWLGVVILCCIHAGIYQVRAHLRNIEEDLDKGRTSKK
ncbi:MAG: hypothetical protein GY835_09005 [bacterium]|nr:hypothetical protein [bacterium]